MLVVRGGRRQASDQRTAVITWALMRPSTGPLPNRSASASAHACVAASRPDGSRGGGWRSAESAATSLLGPDLSADYGPEQFAVIAVESRHLHLLDREIVARAGVDLDARQQHPEFEILEVARLLHDVLAREFVAALLEHVNHSLRQKIAVDAERAALVAFREILVHEGGPFLERGVVLPCRIG